MDLITYKQLVEEKAEQNAPDILPNAGEFHAAIAMSKLLEKTRSRVRMVVGSFNPNVCDQENYLSALKDRIDNNIQFDVIVLNDLNEGSKAYNLLTADSTKPIIIKPGSENFKKKLTLNGIERHFAVFDDDKFRLEKDANNYLAWFSFNNHDITNKLISVFDKEFS